MNKLTRFFCTINFILACFWGLCMSPIIRLWTPKLMDDINHKVVFLIIFMFIAFVGLGTSIGGVIYAIRDDRDKLILIAIVTVVNIVLQVFFERLHVKPFLALISTTFRDNPTLFYIICFSAIVLQITSVCVTIIQMIKKTCKPSLTKDSFKLRCLKIIPCCKKEESDLEPEGFPMNVLKNAPVDEKQMDMIMELRKSFIRVQ